MVGTLILVDRGAIVAEVSRPLDDDHTYARLVAAFKGLSEGKGLSDFVPVQPYGSSTKVFGALNDGMNLKGSLHADHLEVVDAASQRRGLVRGSAQAGEIARQMLEALIPEKPARRIPNSFKSLGLFLLGKRDARG
jgi:hypothetical protein